MPYCRLSLQSRGSIRGPPGSEPRGGRSPRSRQRNGCRRTRRFSYSQAHSMGRGSARHSSAMGWQYRRLPHHEPREAPAQTPLHAPQSRGPTARSWGRRRVAGEQEHLSPLRLSQFRVSTDKEVPMRLRRSFLLAALFTLLTLTLPLAAQQPATSTSTAAACDCTEGNTAACCSCLCGAECAGEPWWWRPFCTSGCTGVCGGGGVE